jgi:hypothetical protein
LLIGLLMPLAPFTFDDGSNIRAARLSDRQIDFDRLADGVLQGGPQFLDGGRRCERLRFVGDA